MTVFEFFLGVLKCPISPVPKPGAQSTCKQKGWRDIRIRWLRTGDWGPGLSSCCPHELLRLQCSLTSSLQELLSGQHPGCLLAPAFHHCISWGKACSPPVLGSKYEELQQWDLFACRTNEIFFPPPGLSWGLDRKSAWFSFTLLASQTHSYTCTLWVRIGSIVLWLPPRNAFPEWFLWVWVALKEECPETETVAIYGLFFWSDIIEYILCAGRIHCIPGKAGLCEDIT